MTAAQSTAYDIHQSQTDSAVAMAQAMIAAGKNALHAQRDMIVNFGTYDRFDGRILYRVGLMGEEIISYSVMEFQGWAKVTIWKQLSGTAFDVLVDDRGTAFMISEDGGYELEYCDPANIAVKKIMMLRAREMAD